MTPLIQHVKTDFDLPLKQIGGELEFATDLPAVKGDPTLLAQIFFQFVPEFDQLSP
jgi:hypothetical protein